jgi:acyl carrier protein
MDKLCQDIKQILVDTVGDKININNIIEQSSLTREVCLDSKEFITFIVNLSEKYDLNLEEDDSLFESLNSIGEIAKFISKSK